jgi:SAM-dependent methyltransferase
MTCCLLCGGSLRACGIAGIRPASVTSDSRPCPLPARIWRCDGCGHLQKAADSGERTAIDALYADYRAHHLSDGREQLTFVPGAAPRPRSQHALAQLAQVLPARGRLLDVGTGAGAVLASAHAVLPDWELYAFDVSDTHRAAIEERPGVCRFYAGDLAAIAGLSFELIVLWHVLEHLERPGEVLGHLRERLAPGGRILVQVPDIERNSYDLAVIDHSSHFTQAHLEALARAAGLRVVADGRGWFHNCLTVALERADAHVEWPDASRRDGHAPVARLAAAVESFEAGRGSGPYAIFGTGMAGIWLAGQLADAPAWFVDEDEARWGRRVSGVEVIGPAALPREVPLVMAFEPATGRALADRLRRGYANLASSPLIVAHDHAAR